MERSSVTSRSKKEEVVAVGRRHCDELYRMAARYARARAIARRVPGLEAECEKLEVAFSKALYDVVVDGRRR